jgi:hypothetical protein
VVEAANFLSFSNVTNAGNSLGLRMPSSFPRKTYHKLSIDCSLVLEVSFRFLHVSGMRCAGKNGKGKINAHGDSISGQISTIATGSWLCLGLADSKPFAGLLRLFYSHWDIGICSIVFGGVDRGGVTWNSTPFPNLLLETGCSSIIISTDDYLSGFFIVAASGGIGVII